MKEGDRYVVNKDLIQKKLRRGDVVTVVGVYPNEILIDFIGNLSCVSPNDLDTLLPSGEQLQLDLFQAIPCDCGGFKTYGSMDSAYHSHTLPCSSLRR